MLDKNTHVRETKCVQSINGGGGNESFSFTKMALSQADSIKWTILVPVWKKFEARAVGYRWLGRSALKALDVLNGEQGV